MADHGRPTNSIGISRVQSSDGLRERKGLFEII